MYNSHRFNREFKREVDINLLVADIRKREELNEYKKLFTYKNLIECREMFTTYLKQCGEHEPVQTSNPWLNKAGNYMLTYSHFIPTNQPYAKRVKKIIDDAKENKEGLHQAVSVFNAVIAIKKVDDEMAEKHINGRVKRSIEALLKTFKLDVDFQQKKSEIENTLNYIKQFDDRRRIISPNVEHDKFGEFIKSGPQGPS